MVLPIDYSRMLQDLSEAPILPKLQPIPFFASAPESETAQQPSYGEISASYVETYCWELLWL
jgi:hypothetical protein